MNFYIKGHHFSRKITIFQPWKNKIHIVLLDESLFFLGENISLNLDEAEILHKELSAFLGICPPV